MHSTTALGELPCAGHQGLLSGFFGILMVRELPLPTRFYRSPPLADNCLSSHSAQIPPQELYVDFALVYEVYEIYESPKWLSVSFRVGERIVWTNVRKWDTWWAEPVSGAV